MTQDNWKTIRVPEDDYQEAKQQKEEHNRTWGEQLLCNNNASTDSVDTDEIVAELTQEIDSMAFNGQMSDDRAERIIKRIDDLENTLPRKIGEELR